MMVGKGVDIGPKTTELYVKEVGEGKKLSCGMDQWVFFEIPESSKGTFAIGKAVAEGDAISIIGGWRFG